MAPIRQDFLPAPGAAIGSSFYARSQVQDLCAALGLGEVSWVATGASTRFGGLFGWGRKASSLRVRRYAARKNLPFWTVEDGFLRSVGLGKRGIPSLSFLLDDLGVYYDARTPSRLETLILAGVCAPEQRGRALALRENIARLDLTKYNTGRCERLPSSGAKRILLVDQVAGDQSIPGALAGNEAFATMVRTAREEHPEAEILIKVHPDVLAGLARGAVPESAREALKLIAEDLTPGALLHGVEQVYTVSSQLGFEALLHGVPVKTFGVPFYAGWGLTEDHAVGDAAAETLARRAAAGRRTLDDLVHAALIAYPVYVDPVTRQITTPEAVVERLAIWRREAQLFGSNRVCVGFSNWKRPHAETYLRSAGSTSRFAGAMTARHLLGGSARTVITWGKKFGRDFESAARSKGHRFLRMEDGFIRSVGLGSNFIFPWSLCLDDEGIYFDSTRPSRLETLLQQGEVTPAEAQRAAALRARLVALGVTKYNLAGEKPDGLRAVAGERRVLLVLGQVPDDHSIRLGQVLPKSNLDLLTRVREANPDAYIIYKEHPDLVSGNRAGLTPVADLEAQADRVLLSGDTARWIEAVDDVHIQTSLAGFEALLRGKSVVCWGVPFYAGWGLTTDQVPCARRKGRLRLDDLVYRTLCEYAAYRLAGSIVPATPEIVLDQLEAMRAAPAIAPSVKGWRARAKRASDYVVGQVLGGLDPRPRR